ncbi:hypothetical protein [Streptomyces sp. HPF1205]|nr:hypothetical protein [Streptomyces sp. HPF1205]
MPAAAAALDALGIPLLAATAFLLGLAGLGGSFITCQGGDERE